MRIYTVYISSICFKSSNISFQEMVKKKTLCEVSFSVGSPNISAVFSAGDHRVAPANVSHSAQQ